MVFDRAQQAVQRGDLTTAEKESANGYRDFHTKSKEWAWKFTILKAQLLHWNDQDDEALKLLASEPDAPTAGDLTVQRLRIEAVAYASLSKVSEAEQRLVEAERLCAISDFPSCVEVVSARGRQEMKRGHYAQGATLYQQVLASARTYHDNFLEAGALLNLSWSADEQTHFDEALDWANAAREIAVPQGFADIAQRALGNMGWAYFKLGDSEKAESMLTEARDKARELHDTTSEAGWLATLGYVYMDAHDFKGAEGAFQDSYNLAKERKSRGDAINALIALAFVYEQTGKLEDAKRNADQALVMAQADKNGRDIVYPLLVQGRIAAQQHDTSVAETAFRQVAQSEDTPVFLKWDAERAIARLYEDEKQPDSAEREYQAALKTFETARCDVRQRVDSRLPFLSNATHIYEDYIHFLVANGRTNDALRAADYTRARTLAEGLGRPCKGMFAPDPLNASEIARRAGGTILFYALGEKQSYLWVVTARKTSLFPVPATRSEIETAVQHYRKKLEGPPEILEASSDGETLYQTLIQPAQDFFKQNPLAKNGKVFIVSDGTLNSLNFETLMPSPKHYWIEDVTITNASSLHLIPGARAGNKNLAGGLLLMGNPVAPSSGTDTIYPELPNAAAEVENVEKHFAAAQRKVFTREQATTGAYLTNKPEQFSYIHFVAHGTASRLSPLDSAVILSRDSASKGAAAQDDSFKLYAREIIRHPLHAQLVTVSACYSAGNRAYSGEGLVGLSWAFVRAGAHNVVGALWDVSDVSISQLMDKFYAELQQGKSPDEALRAAKLSLLHSDNAAFHRPFYWGPFQLYSGS